MLVNGGSDFDMKYFNKTGLCNPDKHYMVDITNRISEMKKLVDAGKYFTINRARQYGKTTTLSALGKYLEKEYLIVSLDFQEMGNGAFRDEGIFTQALARLFMDAHEFSGMPVPEEYLNAFEKINDKDPERVTMDEFFRVIKRWCLRMDKPIVLMVDEVDSATNNQVFLDFLAQLRALYLKREANPEYKTFHSVILAGVTDIKHLKSRIRDEDQSKVNSPWNIAIDFNVDMSLSQVGIRGMLDDYEKDHNTGMDTEQIAQGIRDYTSGYPYLVSRICQIMDERLVPDSFAGFSEVWTENGVDEAVKIILSDGNNALFESLTGKLTNHPELREQLRRILLFGDAVEYLPDDEPQKQLVMYGFVKIVNNKIIISNRIFEMRLYRQFVGENRYENLRQLAASEKNIFVEDGVLNIPKIMQHFIDSQKMIRGEEDGKFAEEEGRERFLTYLSPIINGTGTYSIEEQTRTRQRMDVVIHYLGKRYVIELKIWRGERYNEEGEKQLRSYLDYFGLDTGYLLSFNFNQTKETGVKRVEIGDKVLFEGTV